MSEQVKMDIYVPLNVESDTYKNDKGEEEERWFVRGFASTPDLDLQGEIVQPSGIDMDYFVKSGWINYEHNQDADYVVGAPTDNCYVDIEKGLFVEAVLFKDNPYAKAIWDLADSVDKAGIGRNLGFSIEGYVNKRNEKNTNVIEDIVIRNVAVTKNPANTEATWESFVSKNWQIGTETNPANKEDASALARENLSQAITVITSNLRELKEPEEADKLWADVAEFLDEAGKGDRDNGTVLLQLAKGISKQEATDYLDNKL